MHLIGKIRRHPFQSTLSVQIFPRVNFCTFLRRTYICAKLRENKYRTLLWYILVAANWFYNESETRTHWYLWLVVKSVPKFFIGPRKSIRPKISTLYFEKKLCKKQTIKMVSKLIANIYNFRRCAKINFTREIRYSKFHILKKFDQYLRDSQEFVGN